MFWDAWLHERDVHLQPSTTTPVEEAVVALYALLIASVPALLQGHGFVAEVILRGGGGREYAASVTPGHVVVRAGGSSGGATLEGDLVAVVDALSGRGPEVAAVLAGDPTLREPLTWLRPVLAPAR